MKNGKTADPYMWRLKQAGAIRVRTQWDIDQGLATVREGARFNEVCGQCLGKSLGKSFANTNDNSYSTIQIVPHDIAQAINKARSVFGSVHKSIEFEPHRTQEASNVLLSQTDIATHT